MLTRNLATTLNLSPHGLNGGLALSHGLAGKKGHNLAGKNGHNLAGKNGHNLVGKNGHSLTGKNGHSLAGKNGHNLAGKNGHNLAGKNGHNLAGKNGHSLAGKNGHRLPRDLDDGGICKNHSTNLAHSEGFCPNLRLQPFSFESSQETMLVNRLYIVGWITEMWGQRGDPNDFQFIGTIENNLNLEIVYKILSTMQTTYFCFHSPNKSILLSFCKMFLSGKLV